ncbi:hypothetical protein [Herpetosiphon gulosus]|uniref:Uncharacterized protein n=1 Tax=Herpetosiphon gulosus TaxID=1973496 RepID=A0ABP9X6G7_9CHLR
MGRFDRWFGAGVTDPTVAARQRAAAWGVFLAAQRAALPPRPVGDGVPSSTDPAFVAGGMAPVRSPLAAPATATTTVLVIEDGEEVV